MRDKKWQSEEEIKAQLRDLTDKTRNLRRDLDAVMRASSERRYLHRPTSDGKVNERPRRKKR